jgi:hypothetical protein
MNSEMMAKLRGLIVEAATGECNITAEGKSCPVHGMEECAGYMEESNDIKPAGISDELAAKKIAAKIMGTPDLNIPKIKQYVTKYLSMVGKAPTDVTHLAALVHTELENKGVMESNAKPDFPDLDGDGNKTEPMKDAAKDAKAGKKSTAKKGGMSAKQAKYFGKKNTVKEAASPAVLASRQRMAKLAQIDDGELLKLMQQHGLDLDSGVSVRKNPSSLQFPEYSDRDKQTPDSQRLKNKPQDVLSKRAPDTMVDYPDEYKYMMTKDTPGAKRLKNIYSLGGPKSALPEDDGANFSPELQALMQKYGVDTGDSAAPVDTDSVDEDVHVTVDGPEAQEMISRLMALAGNPNDYAASHAEMPAHDDYADHADMCDGCGCASADCTCDSDIATGYSGPVDLSMEENIDHDFGHTAHSDMGEPVDPDTYMYKAPVGDQRFVKMGDNPLIKENAAALSSKLKKDYRRYVAEAELARSNAGDASPLTADNRDDFDMDPFAGDAPVTDGSRSPLSTVKRQPVNK